MNSSEPLQPLTPHEEKLTAYLDGSLAPEDATAFEQANPEVIILRKQHQSLTAALRTHAERPSLRNGDFFNHQILREIKPPAPARVPTAVPFWRLILAGACCVLVATATVQWFNASKSGTTVPNIARSDAPGTLAVPQYVAKVTDVKAGDHLLTAKLVDMKQTGGLAVVWVDGMDKLSSDYVLE